MSDTATLRRDVRERLRAGASKAEIENELLARHPRDALVKTLALYPEKRVLDANRGMNAALTALVTIAAVSKIAGVFLLVLTAPPGFESLALVLGALGLALAGAIGVLAYLVWQGLAQAYMGVLVLSALSLGNIGLNLYDRLQAQGAFAIVDLMIAGTLFGLAYELQRRIYPKKAP